MASRRRKHVHHEAEHENEERWLVSFADMMTLLFCLFMVLFAISSVNTSKMEALAKSLQEAFSGKVLSGGQAVMETGAATPPEQAQATPPVPAMMPVTSLNESNATPNAAELQRRAKQEEEELQALRVRVEKLAQQEGVSSNVAVAVRRRGLVVELLTDRVFFESGQAVVKPHAQGLLVKIGHIIAGERKHPVVVEGHTDSRPIATSQFPSNWELSGARAGAVVRIFQDNGVNGKRLSTQGFGSQVPVATNATAAGQSRNRRVVAVLTRMYQVTPTRSTP
ncbi:MAG: chemotaxis protein MotB [Solirubrobacteraceae bacterium]|jgi:chemotaxis protein MotB|nr:chemotaxis protein MotB [Solirubrobacteraceae bacterium]